MIENKILAKADYSRTLKEVGHSHYARCTRCKLTMFLKGGSNTFGGQGKGTWFARIDVLNHPNIKLSTDEVILITWLWAKQVGIEQCHSMLGDLIGEHPCVVQMKLSKLTKAILPADENQLQIEEAVYCVSMIAYKVCCND
uniref:Uncharacterized protein n=1 Tax=Romanomermis culicivorax TaxID=13658 RepID=A0A915IGP7_ROMCU